MDVAKEAREEPCSNPPLSAHPRYAESILTVASTVKQHMEQAQGVQCYIYNWPFQPQEVRLSTTQAVNY